MAEFARSAGIPVLSREQLPASYNLVIASDAATCHELASRYVDAVIVVVAHSADHMLQAPPQLGDRCDVVIVLNDRVRRTVEARGWHARVVRLRQPIDLLTYSVRGPCQPVARSALVMTNYALGPRANLIEQACKTAGLRVSWIGASTRPTPTPEIEIASADVVIGLGRSALEAMAGGRAVYVYGVVGGDGWVTPEPYAAMESDGFGGTSLPEVQIDAERMAADLRDWSEQMGEQNRDLASAHHGAREHAIELVALARERSGVPPRAPSLSQELAHLVRLQWRDSAQLVASRTEAGRIRSALSELEREVDALKAALAASEARVERFRRTRRYRLASRIAAPLDMLRKARTACRR